MRGKHKITVSNRFVQYKFEIDHNISVIRGNSGTGKTTLVEMINDYQNAGPSSGVSLSCDKECVALIGAGRIWQIVLNGIHDSIVFIDEGEEYVKELDFARAIQNSDNYYVIVSRDNLYYLPYSVDAIFEIKLSGFYGSMKKAYNRLSRIYSNKSKDKIDLRKLDTIVTEDSHSGFEFFREVSRDFGINCKSANGKSNISRILDGLRGDAVTVVVDGAAFGPEITQVAYKIKKNPNANLLLPESFEWMILRSGLIKASGLNDILDAPYDYIDSEDYVSWERFFTAKLIELTQRTVWAYRKDKIGYAYLSDHSKKAIVDEFFEGM